ncbi:MAG: DEAD/DEAH box helicase [Xanthomonadaceae bacterium]|jgi:ATP-dependent RNA helicase RhlE|nr:DEAD/DEAH box helicase [Xanthomonadaceae bacterium]
MPFQSLGLMPELVRALSDKGYTEPTAIQSQAIPAILNGEDVLGGAQTGTGKTAAFTLPILQRLAEHPNPKAKGPRVLILVPTRELAVQVHASIREYGKHIRLRTAVMYGGASMNPQMMALGKGLDILVATPGRLIDHLERGTAQLHRVETLILDEADRMLDMGFLPAIKKILNQVPKQRQTLLFSATFDAPIKQLALQFMRNPIEVQVSSQNTVAHTVNHIAHPVDPGKKRELLMHILSERYQEQILVFVKTKHLCNRIAEQITKDGIPALAIHGNKSQGQRLKALSDFKAGKVRVLCATDVAARGLDIPLLPLVINFDMPMVAEDYVHRIGRTGRAGANGDAVSLVATDEGGLLRAVNRLLKQDIVLESKPGFEPTTTMRMDLTPPRGKPSGHQAPRRKPAQPGHLKSHGMASQKPKSSSPGGSPRGHQRSPQR